MATIEQVRQLEVQLEKARRIVAASVKAERARRGLSLRQVGRKVRLDPSALMHIENGNAWRTETVARVVRFYERDAA